MTAAWVYMEIKERHMEEKKLFQMGEVTKALGITRRMLLNYEDLGLIAPAVKHDNRGFRYYTADNIVHIRLIRTLQNFGLSLPEIRSYFDDSTNLDEQIERLVQIRNQLDEHIARLRNRQSAISEYEIRNVSLPGFTAFTRSFSKVTELSQKSDELRETYITAIRNYKLDIESKMCIQMPVDTDTEGMYIIPVVSESEGENIKNFPSVGNAICIYYRGAYENFPQVYKKLLEYAEENGLTPHGFFRNIYMEGPPTHGANKDAYLTQIALPIKFADVAATEKNG